MDKLGILAELEALELLLQEVLHSLDVMVRNRFRRLDLACVRHSKVGDESAQCVDVLRSSKSLSLTR